jgi:hypothetical protein
MKPGAVHDNCLSQPEAPSAWGDPGLKGDAVRGIATPSEYKGRRTDLCGV